MCKEGFDQIDLALVIVDELTDNSWELLDKNLSQGHVQYKGSRARNRKSDQALKPALSFLFKDNGIVGRKGKEDPSDVSNRGR